MSNASNITVPSPDTPNKQSAAAITIQVIAITILMLLAVFGNTMMFVSVFRTVKLQTVTNMFTINLAITDFSVGLFILPVLIISVVQNRMMFPNSFCSFIAFLTVVLLLVSISTLAGSSMDRYFCICRPLTYPLIVTGQRVMVVLGSIWMFSIFLASGPFYGWGKYQFQPIAIPMCSPLWDEHASYASVLIITNVLVPLGIMIFSYVRVVQVARKQAKQISDLQLQLGEGNDQLSICPGSDVSKSSTDISAEKMQKQPAKRRSTWKHNLKTLRTVFIVIGGFFLCWGPYVLLNLWSVNNDSISVPYGWDFMTTFLAFSNSAVNPYIFALLNKDFKAAWEDIFRRARGAGPRRNSFMVRSELRGSRITIMEFSQAGSEVISVASFSHRRSVGSGTESELICTVKISSSVKSKAEMDELSKGEDNDIKKEFSDFDELFLPGQVS